jgi:hypothetical protein
MLPRARKRNEHSSSTATCPRSPTCLKLYLPVQVRGSVILTLHHLPMATHRQDSTSDLDMDSPDFDLRQQSTGYHNPSYMAPAPIDPGQLFDHNTHAPINHGEAIGGPIHATPSSSFLLDSPQNVAAFYPQGASYISPYQPLQSQSAPPDQATEPLQTNSAHAAHSSNPLPFVHSRSEQASTSGSTSPPYRPRKKKSAPEEEDDVPEADFGPRFNKSCIGCRRSKQKCKKSSGNTDCDRCLERREICIPSIVATKRLPP